MGSHQYYVNSPKVISKYEFQHIVFFLTGDAEFTHAKALKEMRTINETYKIVGTEYWILSKETAWGYFNQNEKYMTGLKNYKVEDMTNLLHRAEEHFLKSFYDF